MELHKVIFEKLKARGLNIAEEAVAEMTKAVLEGVQEYVVASPNKYDDLALAVIPMAQAIILKEIDKIDGVIAG
jgi:hypothetical protein